MRAIRHPEAYFRHRFKSCCDTIFQACPESGICPVGMRMMIALNGGQARTQMVICRIVELYQRLRTVASCQFSQVISRDTFHDVWTKENIIKCYNEHNAEVRRVVPPDRLLEIDSEFLVVHTVGLSLVL
jgi:hypothetical protein